MTGSPDRSYAVLFLCTANSSRSLIAEALLAHLGGGRFQAYSAGSHPSGFVHPLARVMIEEMHLPTDNMRSKSWDEFTRPSAPHLDFIFTLCDAAAGETCPQWPGQPVTAHWGIDDPGLRGGPPAARRRAFEQATLQIKRRLELFLSLPLASLDSLTLQRELDDIGRMPRDVDGDA
ncbi:MAG: arsenate reductase ArsC [Gammaproteobacteria bacterium]